MSATIEVRFHESKRARKKRVMDQSDLLETQKDKPSNATAEKKKWEAKKETRTRPNEEKIGVLFPISGSTIFFSQDIIASNWL